VKRAIFPRPFMEDKLYAVMSDRGAVVASMRDCVRDSHITIHEVAAKTDLRDSYTDCEFLFGQKCEIRDFGVMELTASGQERHAVDRLAAGDWGPLLVIFANFFEPVEIRTQQDGKWIIERVEVPE
jgi:hypothetical protein